MREKGCGGRVGGKVISRIVFKARLTALESLRMIRTKNVSSEIRMYSEGVLGRFCAILVFCCFQGGKSTQSLTSPIALRIDFEGNETGHCPEPRTTVVPIFGSFLVCV